MRGLELISEVFGKLYKKFEVRIRVENKRQNEIETLNGTLVKFAREKNIDVPINELIYAAIKVCK